MENIVNRIFELVDERGLEQKEFAALIGTTDKKVSSWHTGRTKSYRKYLPQIAEVLETTNEYLLTGQKEKPALPSEDELDAEIIRRLCQLTPEQMKQVDAFVQGLLAAR